MALLPGFERAVLDERKLGDYCLNPEHPRGRHKARVIREALGIGQADSPWLRREILGGLERSEAVPAGSDIFGERWRVDLTVERQRRRAVIRSIWIIRSGWEEPHFVTCWVL